MRRPSPGSPISFRSAFALAALIPLSLGAMKAAQADDLLGLYVGAAYGQAHIRARLDNLPPDGSALGEFEANHSAYQGGQRCPGTTSALLIAERHSAIIWL